MVIFASSKKLHKILTGKLQIASQLQTSLLIKTNASPIEGHVNEPLDARVFEQVFLGGIWLKDNIVAKLTH